MKLNPRDEDEVKWKSEKQKLICTSPLPPILALCQYLPHVDLVIRHHADHNILGRTRQSIPILLKATNDGA